MEKSIETIWKEGFLKNNALVAPKLNNLYNQKSTHIVDKFKRMFKINLIAIIVGSSLFLGISFIMGIPVLGIGFFIISNAIVIVNKKLLPGLEKIDKNASSYQYIKSFDTWMKKQLSVNRRLAGYYYPLIFLTMVLGAWFSSGGQDLFNDIIGKPHQIYLINGMPVLWTIPVILVACILAIFGGRIYNLDVNIVYGRVFKKLEELIADMDELRS